MPRNLVTLLSLLTTAALVAGCTPSPPPAPVQPPKTVGAPQAPPAPKESPAPTPPPEEPGAQMVHGDAYSGVVISAADAPRFYQGATGSKVEGWSPDEAEVRALERKLPGFLKDSAPKRSADLHEKVRNYRRQYLGVVKEGTKLVYINAFCRAEATWDKDIVSVDDGGDCYFQVYWNPATGAFSELSVNGEG